jgi:hypothetical protein
VQPSDEDDQGNILTDEELTRKRMADVQRTPSKEDNNPAAQPEDEYSPPSPEQPRERLCKRYHESKKNEATIRRPSQRHPKAVQITRRKSCNGNCGYEESKLGHTQSFNYK